MGDGNGVGYWFCKETPDPGRWTCDDEARETLAVRRPLDAFMLSPGTHVHKVRFLDPHTPDAGPGYWEKPAPPSPFIKGYDAEVIFTKDALVITDLFSCRVVRLCLDRVSTFKCEVRRESYRAVSVKERWLSGKADDQELRDAHAAALDAFTSLRRNHGKRIDVSGRHDRVEFAAMLAAKLTDVDSFQAGCGCPGCRAIRGARGDDAAYDGPTGEQVLAKEIAGLAVTFLKSIFTAGPRPMHGTDGPVADIILDLVENS